VTENPHHALTGEDGRFEIRGVPPGTWTLRVWHERMGRQEFRVEVPAGRTRDVGPLLMK
jgi:hypothetical protein